MFSLESPQRGDFNEYTQYTISQYKKENHPKSSQICNYRICSKGPKNELETAVVNEPSVFEPLKFYCITPSTHSIPLKVNLFILNPVPGRPTILMIVGQGPIALAVGAGGGCLDIFTLTYPFSPLSPSLWETARYRLKYCPKGPFNPKQPTNIFILKAVIF